MNVHLSPYARAIGIKVAEDADDTSPAMVLEFRHELEGRPGAWHGGAIAGLLENAGYAALRAELQKAGREASLKPINVTVQYLSTGRSQASYARGRIVRLGRRNANIAVEAWQEDPAKPVATAVMNVLMVERG